jgi:hypothetical protein
MSTYPRPDRDGQLSLFEGQCRIQQDQDLIDIINRGNYKQALAIGAIDYFADFVEFVDSEPVDFCIYIQLQEFNFDDLVSNINGIIKNQMLPGSLIYLSLNKYVAQANCYDSTLSADYDTAIEQFITKNINATVEQYQPCGLDFGNKFNWIHPLTRFHLRVAQ